MSPRGRGGAGSQAPSEALGTLAHPLSCARSISNKELSELIEQLQKNADQVEKNIVDTEAKMQSVSAPLCRQSRLTQRFSSGGGEVDSAPQGCVHTSGDIFSRHHEGRVVVGHLVSGGARDGPPHRVIQPQMSVVLRRRNVITAVNISPPPWGPSSRRRWTRSGGESWSPEPGPAWDLLCDLGQVALPLCACDSL